MTADRIHQALYAAFGIAAPTTPPPADPSRFPIFSRPAPVTLHPQRLAAGGTITTAKR
ncbi:hypothetical protein [Azospirillum picis]|uniref:Uncharacterized protein n=1 Tax=Azospirillum picis TaxID=488438 RepID=A0ABU0MNS4_9PROT|nr:hypothetical protein [Azospirillum picis]MBP2301279.1 hypothetical protein [Azospirillum picis]MDQ0535110.1 hypothetical protein [Azospirillum picis]